MIRYTSPATHAPHTHGFGHTADVTHVARRLIAASLMFASLLIVDPTSRVRAQGRPRTAAASAESERMIRAHMGFLAGDALAGRGSGTQFELIAAEYIASQLRQLGIEPSGDAGEGGGRSYLQEVVINPSRVSGPDPASVPRQRTRNVVGVLRGSDARRAKQIVLLSAHMDHLGVRPAADGGDGIYNGADDDASGVVAVLELARALASGRRPRRTIMFVFFGSEETGGAGATEFLRQPPMPLADIVANLEFEMIGRPDAKVGADQLWLTGYERSNLGAELARRGARLVADPHPEQQFFRRSDNYQLARRGVVAHTVSSFGLHKQYHRPDDDLAHIDFDHMTRAIRSMIAPVRRLADSNFVPAWTPGGKP